MPREAHPGVTVVIPTRDRLPMLQESFASVTAQRYGNWRLVVVDDASTDGTAAWLTAQKATNVQVVRCDESVERSRARNMGLERVETPYVLFLDDDDVLHRDALTRMTSVAERHPDAFAAAGARVVFDRARHRRRLTWPHWTVCRRTWPELLTGWVAVGGQTLFRSDLVRDAGGWREGMAVAEDQDLWLRLGYTRPAALTHRTVLRYRLHGASRAPANTRVVERELRERFVGGLSGRDREIGEQAIVAWRKIIASNRAFAAHEHREAARELIGAARVAPWLVSSPITGPGLVASAARGTVAGALPGGGGLALERAVHRGREVVRWYPRSREDDPEGAVAFWSLPFEDADPPGPSEKEGSVADRG